MLQRELELVERGGVQQLAKILRPQQVSEQIYAAAQEQAAASGDGASADGDSADEEEVVDAEVVDEGDEK